MATEPLSDAELEVWRFDAEADAKHHASIEVTTESQLRYHATIDALQTRLAAAEKVVEAARVRMTQFDDYGEAIQMRDWQTCDIISDDEPAEWDRLRAALAEYDAASRTTGDADE